MVENRHPARRRTLGGHARPLERAEDVVGRDLDLGLRERSQLAERPLGGPIGTCVELRLAGRRRRLEAPGVTEHGRDELARAGKRVAGSTKLDEYGHRRPAQLLALLLDADAVRHSPAPQPALDEVDRPALEAGEGRAQEGEEIVSPACEPLEAKEREQRTPERRLSEAAWVLQRVRHIELCECGLERRTPAIDGLADDADRLGSRATAEEPGELGGDELRRAARSRAFEEADRAVERLRLDLVGEEIALEAQE